jgi:hypothetical protein
MSCGGNPPRQMTGLMDAGEPLVQLLWPTSTDPSALTARTKLSCAEFGGASTSPLGPPVQRTARSGEAKVEMATTSPVPLQP